MTNREMKDSGVEWIGEIPDRWVVGKVQNAFYRKKEKANVVNPTILSLARSGIKVRDISNNEGQLAADYSNYNPVSVGDVLLNPMDLVSGANCNISNIEGVISPAYINLRAKTNYSGKYYNYYFKLQYWSYAFFAHGKGVSYENRWTLNNETIMKYPIPVPSYEEQQKIATFLDEKVSHVDSIIEDTKKSIENLKAYKQSLITETVTKGLDPNVEMKDSGIEWIGKVPSGWRVIKYKYLLTINSGSSLTNSELDDDSQYPVYGGGRLIGYSNKYNVNNNNILLGRVGANCGNVTKLISKAWATDNALIIKSSLNKDYLFYLLIAANLNKLNTSSAQPLITGSKVLNFQVPLAPKVEQQQIVKYLDFQTEEIDKLMNSKESILKELESYKKSLIYEYVTGKKEVR